MDVVRHMSIDLPDPFYPPRTPWMNPEPVANHPRHLELQAYQLSIKIGANQPMKVLIKRFL